MNIDNFEFEVVFEITEEYKFMVKNLTNNISIGYCILRPGYIFPDMSHLLNALYYNL